VEEAGVLAKRIGKAIVRPNTCQQQVRCEGRVGSNAASHWEKEKRQVVEVLTADSLNSHCAIACQLIICIPPCKDSASAKDNEWQTFKILDHLQHSLLVWMNFHHGFYVWVH